MVNLIFGGLLLRRFRGLFSLSFSYLHEIVLARSWVSTMRNILFQLRDSSWIYSLSIGLYRCSLYRKYVFFTRCLDRSWAISYPVSNLLMLIFSSIGTLVKSITTSKPTSRFFVELLSFALTRRSGLHPFRKISLVRHMVGVVKPNISPVVVSAILLSWRLVLEILACEF